MFVVSGWLDFRPFSPFLLFWHQKSMQSLDYMLIFAIHCSIFFASSVVQCLVSCFNVAFITFLTKNTVHMTVIVLYSVFYSLPYVATLLCPPVLPGAFVGNSSSIGRVCFSVSFAFMHDITIAHKNRTKRTLFIFYNVFLILSGIVALIF